MDMTNLLQEIAKYRQVGDGVRIEKMVNARRAERGEEPFTRVYINYMLRGERTMLPEVAEVAQKYFEVQKKLTKTMMI